MNSSLAFLLVVALTTFLWCSMLHVTHAGPVQFVQQQQQTKSKREIYPEIIGDGDDDEEKVVEDISQLQVCVVGDLVYEAEDAVPAEQPCLKCKCQPPGVHCEAIRCQKKPPGCRAIHKPNTCCPEYQCECEFEGRVYANGERLEQKPGTECRVCYCRGGEVQCAEVSCYHRNDCEGTRVPGKCCPKYDHCPPREPTKTELVKEALNNNDLNESAVIVSDHHYRREASSSGAVRGGGGDRITIQEIIPEIKEIPITNAPKQVQSNKLLIVEEPTNSSPSRADDSNELTQQQLDDADVESSEVAEVYEEAPPVLRIGDQLVFIENGGAENGSRHSTPATVITVIGAEGLQRGFEDSFESKGNTSKNEEEKDDDTEDEEEDIQNVAESTHILSLLNKKRTTTTTTSKAPPVVSSEISTVDVSTLKAKIEESSMRPDVMVLETNPEYPPIPDVMSPQSEEPEMSERVFTESPEANNTMSQNTSLDETLQITNENQPESKTTDNKSAEQKTRGNKTISGVNADWLKKTLLNSNAKLPDHILNQSFESDFEQDSDEVDNTNTTMASLSEGSSTLTPPSDLGNLTSVTMETKQSVESMEDTLDSGENVTNNSSSPLGAFDDDSMMTMVDASVENSTSLELENDTLSIDTSQRNDSSPMNETSWVETLPGFDATMTPNVTLEADVEMVDPVDLIKGQRPHEEIAKNHTTQNNSTSKKNKRENVGDEAIFEELNREIGLDSGTLVESKSKEEEEHEARTIFSELVNEATSNTTPKPVKGDSQQAAMLQKITDAIAKLTLRGDNSKNLDVSVLGVFRDLFSAQYRAYNN